MGKTKPIGLPKSHHEDRCRGKGTEGLDVVIMGCEKLNQAYLYILHNTQEVVPYIEEAHNFF